MSNPAAGPSTSAPAALAPASSSPLGAADLRALRDAISGQVLVDGDAGFDAARGLHNTHYDRKPGGIVRPADAIDVSRTVQTAQSSGSSSP